MKKNQLAKLGLTLGLVAAVGVGGTMALLSAQSKTVTNTFTVGQGLHDSDITLDEAEVDPETGKKVEPEKRTISNSYNNLEQGASLDKDPTVTIKADAANCYVFVKIDGLKASNGIDPSPYYDVTIDENWIPATTEGLSNLTEEERKDLETKLENVYVYDKNQDGAVTKENDVVSGGLSDKAGLVFNGVTIKKDAPLYTQEKPNAEWVKATLPEIVVKACAVQANNVEYVDALKAVKFN